MSKAKQERVVWTQERLEEFIRTWNRSTSIAEVTSILKLTNGQTRGAVQRLKQLGVELATRRETAIDVEALKRLALEGVK